MTEPRTMSDAELIDEFELAAISNERSWNVGVQSRVTTARAELESRLAAARPAGVVTISLDTANWASVAFAHAPWSDDPEVREHVRRASRELGAAIDVALDPPAPGGPGSEADHA